MRSTAIAAPMNYDLRPGGQFRAHANPQMLAMGLPEVIIDGEVLECAPPHKLVQTYRWLFNEREQGGRFHAHHLGNRAHGGRVHAAHRDA